MKTTSFSRLVVVLVVINAHLLPLKAQTGFGNGQFVEGATAAPRVARSADLDGDGDQDVYYAAAATVGWIENRGNGQFAGAKTISANLESPMDIWAADLNNDDAPDLVASSGFDDNKIAWFANNGDGTFGPEQVLTDAKEEPEALYATDLDDDDLTDVIAISRQTDEVFWLKNQGGDSFSSPKVLSAPVRSPRGVYAADLNGNAFPDLLVITSGDDNLAWFPNNGDGTFGSKKILSDKTDNGWDVFATDLDDDGDMDVLSASSNDEKIAWYQNDGSGNFSEQKVLTDKMDGAKSVHAGDIDGDGDLDVVGTSQDFGPAKLSWFENQGNGSFGAEQEIESPEGDNLAGTTVFLANLVGTDTAELLFTSANKNRIAYMQTRADTLAGPWHLSTAVQAVFDLEAGDINGDGQSDLLVVSEDDNKLVYYPGQGDGQFGKQHVVGAGLGGPREATLVDMNGDSRLDVLGSSFFGDEAYWFENQGNGSFSAKKTIGSRLEGAIGVDAADLDQDGDPDVVVAARNDDQLVWLENLGNGNWADKVVIGTVPDVEVVIAEDLTGDDQPDLVVGSETGLQTAWYQNMGGGSFSEGKDLDPGIDFGEGKGMAVADFFGDGKPDILAVSDGNVGLNLNQGGSFGPMIKLSEDEIDRGQRIRAADADDDGDLDIFVTWESNGIGWLQNRGDTAFSPLIVIDEEGGSKFSGLATADFAGDELPDVVAGTLSDDKVLLYQNLNNQVVVGLEAPKQQPAFRLAPNPSQGRVRLEGQGAGVLRLYDTQGRQLWQKTTQGNPQTLDLGHMPAGLYFLQGPSGTSHKLLLE